MTMFNPNKNTAAIASQQKTITAMLEWNRNIVESMAELGKRVEGLEGHAEVHAAALNEIEGNLHPESEVQGESEARYWCRRAGVYRDMWDSERREWEIERRRLISERNAAQSDLKSSALWIEDQLEPNIRNLQKRMAEYREQIGRSNADLQKVEKERDRWRERAMKITSSNSVAYNPKTHIAIKRVGSWGSPAKLEYSREREQAHRSEGRTITADLWASYADALEAEGKETGNE